MTFHILDLLYLIRSALNFDIRFRSFVFSFLTWSLQNEPYLGSYIIIFFLDCLLPMTSSTLLVVLKRLPILAVKSWQIYIPK